MRRTIWIAALAATALILSACSGGGVTVTIPDRVVDDVTADISSGGGDLEAESAVVGSVTVGAGDERVYRVDLPATDEPALYVYLNQDMPLYVYGANARLAATSRSADFFGTGSGGLSLESSSAVAPQAVAAQDCPGACIILENPGSGHVYARVRNPSSSPRTVTLYAVLRGFDDANEDFDGFTNAPVIDLTESGAIETIGDIDYYRVADDGLLYVDYVADDSGIDLAAEVYPEGSDSGFPVTVNDEDGFGVVAGDRVRVFATNERAAVSGHSQYFLEVVPD